MFVRIARFEGGDPGKVDQQIAEMKESVGQGPMPGLEDAKEFWMLVDRENRRGLGVTIFEDEEGLRRGDEALNAMNPPVDDSGSQRTAVEIYEVAIRETMGG